MKKDAVRDRVPTIRPSDLRTLAFCPRLLFFEVHLKRERTLLEVLRLYLGKAWHFIVELLSEGEGEVRVELEVNGARVRGRADVVREDAVVEIKSGKGPREGAWYGDFLQASLYAMALKKEKVIIKYRDKEVELKVDERAEREAVLAVELLRAVLEGYLPPPKRSKWCPKCPYKELCEALGEEGDEWFPKLPWVKLS